LVLIRSHGTGGAANITKYKRRRGCAIAHVEDTE
jgi:hypothetical protein